jgi:hypothetical protein
MTPKPLGPNQLIKSVIDMRRAVERVSSFHEAMCGRIGPRPIASGRLDRIVGHNC